MIESVFTLTIGRVDGFLRFTQNTIIRRDTIVAVNNVEIIPKPSVTAKPFTGPKVNFLSSISNKTFEWEGRIVRTAGSIDPPTRLVYVYAEVINPYQQSPPLAIGMFVDAIIEGKTIEDGFLVPNSAINNNANIYLIL